MRQQASPVKPSQGRTAGTEPVHPEPRLQGAIQPPSSAAMPERKRGFDAFLLGFVYAWDGISFVVRTQRNMRVHLLVGCLVLALAATLHLAIVEWAILLLCIVAVVVAEMLNTIVEAIIDLITDRYHPLAKIAKDAAAGAVLVTAIGSAGIGLLVLGPHLWRAVGR